MSASEGDGSWDFSPVYDLLQQFAISADHAERRRDFPATEREASGDSSSSVDQLDTPDREVPDTGLGNFDKIWEFLDQSPHVPLSAGQQNTYDSPDATGNGAREPKIVKWRDEIDGADLADKEDTGELLDLSELTIKQRKTVIRHLRNTPGKRQWRCEAAGIGTTSENESEKDDKNNRLPDSKWVIHRLLHASTPTQAGTPITAPRGNLNAHGMRISSEALQEAKVRIDAFRKDAPREKLEILKREVAREEREMKNEIAREQRKILKRDIQRSSEVNPSAFAIAAARKQKLMNMLNERFPDERQFLNSISLLPHPIESSEPTPEGLHVFIDASNIIIGFHDALKAAHSLPREAHIRRQPLSFHSFSLILTRGRPTSKLVLVGSDNFPAIAEAKTLGYETNILDRVHKAKELTDRQKYFAAQQRSPGSRGDLSTGGSGSETGPGTATYAHKKWVEQAVDEILHLKMMESLVDCPEPGTMILASGDAAEAEYSGGFFKMVERSLMKGWNVEVACFRTNTSGMYRRKEFREKWGNNFKLLELDAFVEVLQGSEWNPELENFK